MEVAQETGQKKAKPINRKIMLIISLMIACFGAAFFYGQHWYNQQLSPIGTSHAGVLVEIPAGSTTADVSTILINKRLTRNKLAFALYARWHKYDGLLKSGTYNLSPDMSVPVILQKITNGDVVTYTFTIPEGYNTKQIADLLAKKKLINRSRFMDLVANGNFNYDFLKGAPTGERRLEGFLFPATYKIPHGTKEVEIIDMMLKRFQKELTPEFLNQAKFLNMSVKEIVTLASIVEREAKTADDRPKVSAVFHNRLQKKMKLESCATVQYIIGDPNKKILSYKDIAIDSPYNTYKNTGLPIAPIASPGLAALLAALNPAKVSYLYFVAKPDGSNEFTKTLAEHEAAKRKYLGK